MSRNSLQPPTRQREETTVRMYLRDIHQYGLLSPREERKLARKARRGDTQAREKMIQSNLRLVVSIAKQFIGRGLPFIDLIEEGNLGLILAVKKFEPSRHYKFSTYATWWIKQRIKRAMQEAAKSMRTPPGIIKLVTDYRTSYAALEEKYGRSPTSHELAREMRLPTTHVQTLKRAIKSFSMESRPVPPAPEGFSPDDISDDDGESPEASLLTAYESAMLRELLSALDDREAKILRMRFGMDTDEPATLVDVGTEFKITRERVRQIEKGALEKLLRILRKHPDYASEAAEPGTTPPRDGRRRKMSRQRVSRRRTTLIELEPRPRPRRRPSKAPARKKSSSPRIK